MRTIILITVFLFITRVLLAPEFRAALIDKAHKIDPYKRITEAVSWIESRHNDTIVNWKELAYGRYQIRQVRLDDYFQRTGIRYELTDMFNPAEAGRVFRYYAVMEGWRNPERIARCWNGGVENGMRYKQTVRYWNEVKKLI